MVATVPSMIGQFNMSNIKILQDLGYEVDVATDFSDRSVWTEERVNRFREELDSISVYQKQIDFSRSPFRLTRHIQAFKEIKELIKRRDYSLIHTHTPVASAIVRLAARKTGAKVIYTAHGFHFYAGAPLKNWIVFYPIEKWLSKYADVLITINKEDYKRAAENFKARKTVYVPGVGVDIERFAPDPSGRERVRKELGIDETQTMILSVGELNENKNHSSVIQAIADTDYVYVIVGKGDKKEELKKLAEKCNIDLRLMGFRTDVPDFYNAADVYVLPSIREGLNVSLLEAMANGLPVACSNIRGNIDLINSPTFNPKDVNDIRKAIKEALEKRQDIGTQNRRKVCFFSKEKVANDMRAIYEMQMS